MGAPDVADMKVRGIASFNTLLRDLLDEAAATKPPASDRASSIEPPLSKHDFPNISERVAASLSDIAEDGAAEADDKPVMSAKTRKFFIIETVARDTMSRLVASTPITSDEFVQVWNLFDIISIIFLANQCEPALLFYLIEDLLESQTIAGCRIIFSYLESRRVQITGEEHFDSIKLIILRSCNELLRRLSRAEDTAFCGRVFIFLFQAFPLGDLSSVNQRGKYHVENVTDYEVTPEEENKMDVDAPQEAPLEAPKDAPKDATTDKNGKSTRSSDKKKKEAPPEPPALPATELYRLFWPLQETFSQPLTLFQPATFKSFRTGVEETVRKFRTYPCDQGGQTGAPKNLKRKHDETVPDDQVEAFNPKYLSSRDLFELEIGDLQFRRHILVQMLIVLNFILSWTPEAKKKYEAMYEHMRKNEDKKADEKPNLSVMYAGDFSAEDAKWAKDTRERIEGYLKGTVAGRIFYRMVDTVLSRDKNWVYWKMRTCPKIERNPVPPQAWADAQGSAKRMTTNKRLRPMPLNAVNMDFLKEDSEGQAMAELQDPKRYKVPELDSYKALIADDDFDISMAAGEAKVRAIASKASKSWRAIRIARDFKIASFDKIDDPTDISAVFEPLDSIDSKKDEEETANDEDFPSERETIIIVGAPGVGKSALISKLSEAHKGVFGRVVRHTARAPLEGEKDGKDFHFVKPLEFNQMRDGDRLVEYTGEGDASYGTSSKAIDLVTEDGKIPVIEMGIEAAKFAKDMMDFPGRYILVNPPTPEALQSRLTDAGKLDEASIKAAIDSIPSGAESAKISDKVIINDDLDSAASSVSNFIYGRDGVVQENGTAEVVKNEGGTKDPSTEAMQVDATATES